jgi:hypothetical protein
VLLFAADRRAARADFAARQLSRLAEVPVRPASGATGRILTVAVRPNAPPSAAPAALQEYIQPWWKTVDQLRLPGTVLVSGWSDAARRTVETQCIETVEVPPGPRHIFFERHFLVRDFLHRCNDEYVCITDGSDVAFKRDPFVKMRAADGERRLFIGRERRRILFCRCVRREMRRQFGRVWFPLRPVLNPGILGGRREVVMTALDRVCELIEAAGARLLTSDMCFVNRAIHAAFAPHELVTGEPLHSRFKGWEFDTTAAILHK